MLSHRILIGLIYLPSIIKINYVHKYVYFTFQSPFVLWNEAIQPLFNLFNNKGWDAVVKEYGSYNVKQYLTNWSIKYYDRLYWFNVCY